MFTVESIQQDLDRALKAYGEYTFDDKGPGEVLDIRIYRTQAERADSVEVGKVLLEIYNRRGRMQRVAESIKSNLEGQPDEWWDAMHEVSGFDY